MTAALIAAAHSNSQGGLDWLWIVVVLLAVVVGALLLMGIFMKSTSVSRGGVEHPDRDKRRGNPPFESVERHS